MREEQLKPLGDKESIRKIESRSFLDKKPEELNSEYKEMLGALFGLLKEGVVKLRVKHKKEDNSWIAEIYFVDTGGVWYYTDLPDEVRDLMATILKNGYKPECIEE